MPRFQHKSSNRNKSNAHTICLLDVVSFLLGVGENSETRKISCERKSILHITVNVSINKSIQES